MNVTPSAGYSWGASWAYKDTTKQILMRAMISTTTEVKVIIKASHGYSHQDLVMMQCFTSKAIKLAKQYTDSEQVKNRGQVSS